MTITALALAAATLYAGAPPPMDPEVATHLRAIHTPGGSPTDMRDRERAIAWLITHADRSFSEALSLAEAAPHDVVLIDLLARYRRKETTSFLARAFRLGDPARRLAAAGLGTSPDPSARAVLVDALSSTVVAEVEAALAGLEASGDARECPRIVAYVKSPNVELRWRAVHAAGILGCLKQPELEAIVRTDPEQVVQDAAKKGIARLLAPDGRRPDDPNN